MEQKEQIHSEPKKHLGDFGKILLFIITAISIILMFTIFYYLEDWRAENIEQTTDPEDIITSGMLACVEMGCPLGTKYIGSNSGEVYHDCTSGTARSIVKDNRVCFSSADDAIAKGYRN
jgi:hypothetical protein